MALNIAKTANNQYLCSSYFQFLSSNYIIVQMKGIEFTSEEEAAVIKGEAKHRHTKNKWVSIKNDLEFTEVLRNRTKDQIKDKYKTIVRQRMREADNIALEAQRREEDNTEIEAIVPPRKRKQEQKEWSLTETIALLDCFRRLGSNGEWFRQIKSDKEIALKDKSPEEIKVHWMDIKDTPRDDPLPYCVSCVAEVTCPQVGIGKNAEKFLTKCSAGLGISAKVLALFLSPMSGSTFATQKMMLTKWYHEQLPPNDARKAIDMDHDPRFKADPMSKVSKDQAKSKTKPRKKPYDQELLQGRCVAMLAADHTTISTEDSQTRHDNNEERKTYLRKRRKDVNTDVLENEVIGDLGKSMENFMASPLFWGHVDASGNRISLEDCLDALRKRWDHILHQAMTSPALRWFIWLGHGRVRRVLYNVTDLPEDFRRVDNLLKACGPIWPPIRLVTLEEIDRHMEQASSVAQEAPKVVSMAPSPVSSDDESDDESAKKRMTDRFKEKFEGICPESDEDSSDSDSGA